MRLGLSRPSIPILGVLCLWLIPCAAQAQRVNPEARAIFEQGVAAAEEGRWEDARELFVQADALMPHPNIRINLAAALVQTRRLRAAADLYELILEEHRRAVRGRRRELRATLSRIRARLSTLDVQLDGALDGDSLAVDSEDVPVEEGRASLVVDPGPHVIEVRRGSEVISRREIEAGEGQQVAISIALVETRVASVEDDPAESAPTSELNWLSIGLMGGGALALGGIIYPLVRVDDIQNGDVLATHRAMFASSTSSVCEANGEGPGEPDPELAGICTEADGLFIAQMVLLAAGGAALIGGAVLMIVQGPVIEFGESARLRPVLGPGLAALHFSADLDAR